MSAPSIPASPVVARLAAASGDERFLWLMLSDPRARKALDAPPLKQALDQLIDKSRMAGNEGLFARLVSAGIIDKPASDEDLPRLLRAVAPVRLALFGGSSREDPRFDLLEIAVRWASDQPDNRVLKMISAAEPGGVAAAVVAGLRWQTPSAIQALLAVATAKPSSRGSGQNVQLIALQALAVVGRSEDAEKLLAALAKIPPDEYESTQVRQRTITTLAAINPQRAIAAFAGSGEEGRYSGDGSEGIMGGPVGSAHGLAREAGARISCRRAGKSERHPEFQPGPARAACVMAAASAPPGGADNQSISRPISSHTSSRGSGRASSRCVIVWPAGCRRRLTNHGSSDRAVRWPSPNADHLAAAFL